ncbi:MAG TPA: hypothetical protein PLQ67_04000, partial [Burkholderiaceae bacterium]|nr:hypothetical protein [Burkholderiaceae bacterium]
MRALYPSRGLVAATCWLVWLYTLCLAPASAQQAKDHGITVFGGWRFGGSFEQDDPNAAPSTNAAKTDAKLRDHGAASVALDIGLDARRQFELLISHQSSSIELAQNAAPHLALPLKTTTVHIGGTYFFEDPHGQIGRGPYVVGGIGND